MKRPSAEIAVEINRTIREADEWFEEPDDLARLEHALSLTETVQSPLELAAAVAYRVAHAQAFSEGNKRTAVLLSIWIMDNNGLDRAALVFELDEELAKLLVQAASGADVEAKIHGLFQLRLDQPSGS